MLIKFSLTNYKTFRERAEWNMVATEDITFEEGNVIAVPEFGLRLLKSTVVYGANASGKTKLLTGLGFMRNFVWDFLKKDPDAPIRVEPFLLSTSSANEPTEFEIIFLSEGIRFRYGFEATADRVIAEWLFQKQAKQINEKKVFYREEGQVLDLPIKGSSQLKRLEKDSIVRANELLLPKAVQYNNSAATQVWKWFRNLVVIPAHEMGKYKPVAAEVLETPLLAPRLLELIRDADFSVTNAALDIVDINSLPENEDTDRLRAEVSRRSQLQPVTVFRDVKTQHIRFDHDLQEIDEVTFLLSREESKGTQQFFTLVSLALRTLESGGVLVVDELDTALHPQLVRKIVSLFHSPTYNLRGAQLLFNTHDTNLLAADSPFRRDQIWFTEKDKYGAAKLYSLSDFKLPASAQSGQPLRFDHLERDYLNGRYGAVPFLGRFGYSEMANDKNAKRYGE